MLSSGAPPRSWSDCARCLLLTALLALNAVVVIWLFLGVKLVIPLAPAQQYPTGLHEISAPLASWVLDYRPDGPRDNFRSNARLFEDGTPLGPAHAAHADIAASGAGRFSHWMRTIMFSASDNSDPITNNRNYRVELTAGPSVLLLVVVGIAAAFAFGAFVMPRLAPAAVVAASIWAAMLISAFSQTMLSLFAAFVGLFLVATLATVIARVVSTSWPPQNENLYYLIAVTALNVLVYSLLLPPLAMFLLDRASWDALIGRASVALDRWHWSAAVAAGVFIILAAFGRRRIQTLLAAVTDTAMFTTSFAVAVLSCEVVLTFLHVNYVAPDWLHVRVSFMRWFGGFDSRNQIQFVEDYRKRTGKLLFPGYSNGLYTTDAFGERPVPATSNDPADIVPLGGLPGGLVTWGNETGSYTVFQLDRYGFNNPDSIWDKPHVDVTMVGSSFCLGDGLPQGQGVGNRLSEHYPTLNLSYVGNGPLTFLGTIVEYGARRKPDVVVLCFYEGEDLHVLNEEKQTFLRQYLRPGFSQHLESRIDDLKRSFYSRANHRLEWSRREISKATHDPRKDFPNGTWVDNLPNVFALTRLRNYLIQLKPSGPSGPAPDSNTEHDIDLFSTVLSEFERVVSAWGGKVIVAYLPDGTTFRGMQYAPVHSSARERKKILETLAKHPVTVVDLTAPLLKDGNPLRYYNTTYVENGHLNARGQQLLADEIVQAIRATTGAASQMKTGH